MLVITKINKQITAKQQLNLCCFNSAYMYVDQLSSNFIVSVTPGIRRPAGHWSGRHHADHGQSADHGLHRRLSGSRCHERGEIHGKTGFHQFQCALRDVAKNRDLRPYKFLCTGAFSCDGAIENE